MEDGHADNPLVEGLTPSQREAVEATEGPVLVLAGPGSGKTRVITRRIAYLLALGVPPWRVLAVTFTNKAAGEMRHRVETLLGGANQDAQRLTITTFHSLCVRLLRRYAEASGLVAKGVLKAAFNVFDDDDQQRLVKQAIATLQLSTSNFPPRSVLGAISNAKNELIEADEFAKRATDFHGRNVARVYREYQNLLRAAGGVDFDDLLLLTVRMLRESAEVRAAVQARYRYLLVDEYQDTNRAQFLIASLIAGGGVGGSGEGAGAVAPSAQPNICVVGDPDQSIYGWRGADLRNILQFEERYPGAKVIRLGENFRSRAPILAVADRLIQNNTKRKHKPLIPTRGAGPGVEVVMSRDEHHEARLAVDWLREHKASTVGLDWKDCAVFYRTNALSRVVEDEMRRAGIPYVMVRGTAFYQREEIKNALAYLRLVANPADSVSLERIINTPARGISDATFQKIMDEAATRGPGADGFVASPMEVLREVATGGGGVELAGLLPRARQSVAKFVAMLDGWSGFAHTGVEAGEEGGLLASAGASAPTLAELVERVVRESGLEKMYADEEERRENLAELVSSAAEFEQSGGGAAEVDPESDEPPQSMQGTPGKLRAYLEKVALVADTDALDPRQGAVTLMTLHAAKGLEYPLVALIGLEEGMLPHSRSAESEESLEEERRLAFVGITRAMERLLITCAKFRTIRGLSERTIPSRFLDEIKGQYVSFSDQSDPFGDAPDDHEMRRFIAGGSGGGGRAAGGGGSSAQGRAAPRGEDAAWAPGTPVRHPQFGMGVVQQFWGGQGARVQVKFQQAGVKTLMLEYARLTRL